MNFGGNGRLLLDGKDLGKVAYRLRYSEDRHSQNEGDGHLTGEHEALVKVHLAGRGALRLASGNELPIRIPHFDGAGAVIKAFAKLEDITAEAA